ELRPPAARQRELERHEGGVRLRLRLRRWRHGGVLRHLLRRSAVIAQRIRAPTGRAQIVREACGRVRGCAGIRVAMTRRMAAALALVMLPIIASVGFFLGVIRADGSFAAAFAGGVFVALATGVLAGALSIARRAEQP